MSRLQDQRLCQLKAALSGIKTAALTLKGHALCK